MTQDEIIRMMKEAGFYVAETDEFHTEWERFASLVAVNEREACAKLLEDAAYTGRIISCTSAAKAIRARGNQ